MIRPDEDSTEMWCVFYSIAMAIYTFKGGTNALDMDTDSQTIADRMVKTVEGKVRKAKAKKEKQS